MAISMKINLTLDFCGSTLFTKENDYYIMKETSLQLCKKNRSKQIDTGGGLKRRTHMHIYEDLIYLEQARGSKTWLKKYSFYCKTLHLFPPN